MILEIAKKGKYKTKNFSETTRVDQSEPSVQSEQAKPEQQLQEIFTKKLKHNQTYLHILVHT